MPHDTVANFSTLTTPFGKTLYLADVTSYEQLGSAVSGQMISHSIAGSPITGTCKDAHGEPVFGCAIQIGKEIAYSDNRGEWSIRVKGTKSQPIAVVVNVFANPGDWRVVLAPETVASGTTADIVVERVQGVPNAKSIADSITPAETAAVPRKNFWKRLWAAATGRG